VVYRVAGVHRGGVARADQRGSIRARELHRGKSNSLSAPFYPEKCARYGTLESYRRPTFKDDDDDDDDRVRQRQIVMWTKPQTISLYFFLFFFFLENR